MNIIEERTIALAGLIQASMMVQSLARTGIAKESSFESSIKSILVLDAINTPAVFGGLQGVEMGLSAIDQGKLGSTKTLDVEVLQYAMYLIQLQTQLQQDNQKFQNFALEVERLSAMASDELIEACSNIYQTYISPMRPQILVQGEEGFLLQDGIAPKVRALLLAGIRSAALLQQKGGGRFKIIWQRGKIVESAGSLLRHLTPMH